MKKIKLGLIGKTLKHSFSKKYFNEKFKGGKENSSYNADYTNFNYDLYALSNIEKVKSIFDDKDFVGFNITIPYKQDIIPYLTDFQSDAKEIGAVNVVGIERDRSGMAKKIKGYNTDYIGFKNTLEGWIPKNYEKIKMKALVLGTGGASKAIKYALMQLKIPYVSVSRTKNHSDTNEQVIVYEQLLKQPAILEEHKLIINTTPLGTYPDNHLKPNLPYNSVTSNHYLYDLVYNPEVTSFLQEGVNRGASIQNGYNMLVGQAEASWDIWEKYL